jgi:uncharacterized damage-inducible protein DinB
MNDLIETWNISNRINLYLLDAIKEEYLSDLPAGSKGRDVGKQFAHLHNVRLMWLKVSAPKLHDKQSKIDTEKKITKKILSGQLKKSGAAIAELLQQGIKDGKIKGFKPHPSAFLGYILAHEGHHRGQILLSLRQSGHAIDQKTQYGLWEWGVR